MKPFNHYVREEDLVRAIAALTASGDLGIARKWQGHLDNERKVQESAAAAEASLAEHRAERAAEHLLTRRQAEGLAAIRAGHSLFYTWSAYSAPITRGDGTISLGHWSHGRSMGGAINRMAETLRDEGLIEPRGWSLTPAGLARLEAWETQHPKINFPKGKS